MTRPQQGSRIPEDWWPSDETWEWARKKRPEFTEAELKDITEDFVDYWLSEPGVKACKLNWSRTYQRWIRTTSKPRGFHGGHDNTPRGLVF